MYWSESKLLPLSRKKKKIFPLVEICQNKSHIHFLPTRTDVFYLFNYCFPGIGIGRYQIPPPGRMYLSLITGGPGGTIWKTFECFWLSLSSISCLSVLLGGVHLSRSVFPSHGLKAGRSGETFHDAGRFPLVTYHCDAETLPTQLQPPCLHSWCYGSLMCPWSCDELCPCF